MSDFSFSFDQAYRYFVHRLPLERIAKRDSVAVRCPFHEDHNPSLSLNLARGLWNCHGCNLSGGILDFEMRMMSSNAETAWKEIFRITGAEPPRSDRRLVKAYDYLNVRGEVVYQKLRYEPKDFRQRQPDGKGGWLYNLDGVKKVLYNLPTVITSRIVAITEGEKDSDNLKEVLPAEWATTTNFDGAGKWKDEYSPYLIGRLVVVVPDNDLVGMDHAETVAASVSKFAYLVKIVRIPDMPNKGDISDWIALKRAEGLTNDEIGAQFMELVKSAPVWARPGGELAKAGPWASEAMDEFLQSDEQAVRWIVPGIIAAGCLIEIFAPRGVGKSLIALFFAVQAARAGLRVLILDRDNPRRVVRERLLGFGAEGLGTLRIITRESCPPLTKSEAWADFPYAEVDLVIVDSLDAMSEGVGEQDSSKPARALSSLLDICHRENGPAVLVLGNTVKSGSHSRGSGVVEDRADIVFEARDVTEFHPSGTKPWVEELPAQGAADWQARSVRRKGRAAYRLALIPTKFRLGEEPAPQVLEVNMAGEPCTVRDVTAEFDAVGEAERRSKGEASACKHAEGVALLRAEICRRVTDGLPAILKKRAEDMLMAAGLKRMEARAVMSDSVFRDAPGVGPGHPRELHINEQVEPTAEMEEVADSSNEAASVPSDFGRPYLESMAEIGNAQTPMATGDFDPVDSAAQGDPSSAEADEEGAQWLLL